jgi:hypothetical protein
MKQSHSLGLSTFLISVVAGLAFLAPQQAAAISVFFDPAAINFNELVPGNRFSVDMLLDTEGETDIELVSVSVQFDPNVLSFIGGSSPGLILFDPDTLLGLQRLSQPFVLPSDPAGTVRAASFGGLEPSGVASSNQLLATLTFELVGAGPPLMSAFFALGDDVIVNGVSVKDSVTLGSIAIVPEPGTALLMGLGLAGLAAASRRR